MLVLALDTTTRAGSVAVVDGTRTIVEHQGDASRPHAERLPGELTAALAEAGLSVHEVDLFAIASGPGSFTGLRIGIATLQGLAFVTRKRIVPVSALLALAYAGSVEEDDGSVGVWMDAHRRDVFSAMYRIRGGAPFDADRLAEIDPPAVATPENTWMRWVAAPPSFLIGDGAVLYKEVVGAGTPIVSAPLLAPVIGRLAGDLAARGHAVHPAAVQPLYIRRPDAEIARDARQPGAVRP